MLHKLPPPELTVATFARRKIKIEFNLKLKLSFFSIGIELVMARSSEEKTT